MLEVIRAQLKRLTDPDLSGRLRKRRIRQRAMIYGARYLGANGWQESIRQDSPVDESGDPIPWITYPALSVLNHIVRPHHRIFEYGCGHSSLWWAARAGTVISVDHDAAWVERIAPPRAPKNLTITLKRAGESTPPSALIDAFFAGSPNLPLRDAELDVYHGLACREFTAYAAEIEKHEPFDIVVVDSMARSLCAWMAGHFVKAGGLIVFDNTDRWQYNAGYQALADLGFGRIDFVGPSPMNVYENWTSIFSATCAGPRRLSPSNQEQKAIWVRDDAPDFRLERVRHYQWLIKGVS